MRMKIIFPVRLGLAPCFRRRQYQCFVGFQLNYQWFILRFLLFRIFMSILLISYLPLQIILLFCNDQCISKVTYVEAYLMCSLFVYSSLNSFNYSLFTLTEWDFCFRLRGMTHIKISWTCFSLFDALIFAWQWLCYFFKYVIVCTYIMAMATKLDDKSCCIRRCTQTLGYGWRQPLATYPFTPFQGEGAPRLPQTSRKWPPQNIRFRSLTPLYF